MVTHDQEEALTMSDRIVVMSKGRIEQVGTPDEIYSQPATAFVADFVGKMNFLDGRLLVGEPRRRRQGAALDFTEAVDCGHGAPVTVCLRPEDVVVRDVDRAARNALEVAGRRHGVHRQPFRHHPARARAPASTSPPTCRSTTCATSASRPAARSRVALPPDRLRVFPQPPPTS